MTSGSGVTHELDTKVISMRKIASLRGMKRIAVMRGLLHSHTLMGSLGGDLGGAGTLPIGADAKQVSWGGSSTATCKQGLGADRPTSLRPSSRPMIPEGKEHAGRGFLILGRGSTT